MAAKKHKHRVILLALDSKQQVLEEAQLSCDEYYDSSHPMIDDSGYRRTQGIRVIRGSIFDGSGKLDQSFENRYNARGTYISGKATHGNGG